MSKKYGVSIPINGYVYVEVDAESEEEAQEKAFQMEHSKDDIEEWDLYEHIVEGNVLYGILNDIEVEELE